MRHLDRNHAGSGAFVKFCPLYSNRAFSDGARVTETLAGEPIFFFTV
jgi:hypothetical protein